MLQDNQGSGLGVAEGRAAGDDLTGDEGRAEVTAGMGAVAGGETGVLDAGGVRNDDVRMSPGSAGETAQSGGMKVLKPLPHAVMDYAWAGTMMAAPWLFGFSRNRKATANAVASGAGILALSLMTRYPLGAVKLVPFPVHGVIEAAAGAVTAGAPWLMGFSRNKGARWTHLISGLATLAVVALTDYKAAERQARPETAGGRGPAGGA